MGKFDRDAFALALDMLGGRAREAGVVCELAVFGGSWLLLASDLRDPVAEVDDVFAGRQGFLEEVQVEVARSVGLPDDWIAGAVEGFCTAGGGATAGSWPFGEYPKDNHGAVGLRVVQTTPQYLLVLKLMAAGKVSDRELAGLMRAAGIEAREELVSLLEGCYPNIPISDPPRTQQRTLGRIDAVMEQFDAARPSTTGNAFGSSAAI